MFFTARFKYVAEDRWGSKCHLDVTPLDEWPHQTASIGGRRPRWNHEEVREVCGRINRKPHRRLGKWAPYEVHHSVCCACRENSIMQ